jgi:hypothetical protein
LDATLVLDGFSSLRNALGGEIAAQGTDRGAEVPVSALFDPLPVAVLRAVPTPANGGRRMRALQQRPAAATA